MRNFAPMPVPSPDGTLAQYFITCVKLPPGKNAKSLMDAIEHAIGKEQRHSRGIHEEHSFVTLGRYDLVVIWRAPDLQKMAKFWNELVDACGKEMGETETLVAISKGTDSP